MSSGKIQMAKMSPELKKQLKYCAVKKQTTMTELVKYEIRELLKQNHLPTI